MNAVIRMHSALMQKYPWKTVAFSTGFVMSTGDAISQKFVERNEKFDCKRYVRYWAFGVIIAGPLFHGWYIRLQKIFGKSKLAPFKMVAVDQLVFAPVFPPFFLGVMGLMKGDSFSVIKQKIQKDYLDILTSCWSVWPGVQFVNFLLVPISHRVLFNNTIALGWDTYLAWKADASKQKSTNTLVRSKSTDTLVRSKPPDTLVRSLETTVASLPVWGDTPTNQTSMFVALSP